MAAVTDKHVSRPRFVMQFHITGRCNLRCKHCYREEGNIEPLSTDDLFSVLRQYEELLAAFQEKNHTSHRGHINITGGEPFFRKDIDKLLHYLGEHRDKFTYGVLSNGSMIDDKMMTWLRNTRAAFVQLSIDGYRETHDALRADGDYDRTLAMAKRLEQNNIPVHISFTANRENYCDLPQIAWECRKQGVTCLWSDRLVPIGRGADLLSFDDALTEEYLRTLRKARGSWLVRKIYPHTEIRMNRALQFLQGGQIYQCGAAKTLITVDEMGQILPCRRMPIVCGNVFDTTLKDVFFQHPTFKKLREDLPPLECIACPHHNLCRGGAKCQSYAAYHDFTRADPGCPLQLSMDAPIWSRSKKT